MIDFRVATANAAHTQEQLLKYFSYDADTGRLTWKVGRGSIKAGSEAKTPHNTGYLSVQVDGTSYLVHRVIWCIVHGEFPHGLLDHINMIKTDNRINNLRVADATGNNCNQDTRKDNSSGIKGVSWSKRTNSWQARTQVNGVRTQKYFKNKDDAEAHVKAERTERHAQFANHGESK